MVFKYLRPSPKMADTRQNTKVEKQTPRQREWQLWGEITWVVYIVTKRGKDLIRKRETSAGYKDIQQRRRWRELSMDSQLSQHTNRSRLLLTLQLSRSQPPQHHEGLHWIKNINTTGKSGELLFWQKIQQLKKEKKDDIALLCCLLFWLQHWRPFWNSFPKHDECDFYLSSVAGQWFWLAMLADYGSINTEPGALDMINRYGLERASGAQTLLKERQWDYNGVDMDYKMEETGLYDETCMRVHFWKTSSYWMLDNGPNNE